MDGVEAANRIKTRYKIPIVYLTAYSEDSTLERAKITEPFGYLTKPFEERTLQATVEMALYRATMQGKLRRNKEKLETILQCIAEGVVVTSVNGTIEYLNPAAQKLLLRDETLSQGVFLQQVFRAVDAYTRKPVVLPVSKILMEGENVQLADLLLHTREQGRLPIDCSLAPLRDENGSIRGMVLAFRSVAERWKMQEIVGREVRQAIELQRSLLPPQGTSLPRLQMRWFFFPAALAAGDLFNLFPIDPTHVGIYMVDAPGHGIASAVNSLLLHQFLSIVPGQGTYLKLLDADALDPVQVAQKLAARLSSGGDLQSFSLVYGIIETESGVVTMVRTGLPGASGSARQGAGRDRARLGAGAAGGVPLPVHGVSPPDGRRGPPVPVLRRLAGVRQSGPRAVLAGEARSPDREGSRRPPRGRRCGPGGPGSEVAKPRGLR